MPIGASNTFKIKRLDPCIDPDDAEEVTVNLKPSTTFLAGQVLGEMIGTDEVQQIVIDAAGGTWVYTYAGQSASGLAWNISAADLQTAIQNLSNVGVGNVRVQLTAAGTYRISFINALGSGNRAAATTTATGLTGGAGTAVVSTLTGGVAGTRGVFAPYASGNTDGSQVARLLLRYGCVTDANGLVTIGDGPAGTSEHGFTQRYADAYYSGIFATADLVGLDATAIGHLGRLIDGTVENGRLALVG